MKCTLCKGTETKIVSYIDEQNDVERTVCANEDCEWIIREEVIVPRPDGTQNRLPRRVAPDQQPVKAVGGAAPATTDNRILSAQEMMEKAIKMREETIGKQIKDLLLSALEGCAEPDNLLAGKYKFLVEEGTVQGIVLAGAVKELRGLGYTVTKSPKPGEGTWIEVKWPTKRAKKRKDKKKTTPGREKPPVTTEEISFPNEKDKPKRGRKKKSATSKEKQKKTPPSESTKRQAAAAKHRQEALKARSDLPK